MASGTLPQTKRCGKCKIIKPIIDFSRDAHKASGLQSRCKECQRAIDRKRYAENSDRERARAAANREADPELHRQRTRSWRKKNPHKVIDYRTANKDRDLANAREWHARNRQKIAKRKREYDAQHLIERAIREAKRRASKRASQGTFTLEEIKILLKTQNYSCANPHCCADLRREIKHLDHVKPLARGGSNNIENLQWLCRPCNSRKSDLEPAAWLAREARRLQSSFS